MRLLINEKGEIVSYARTGGLEDSIEFVGDLPIDFVTKFRPTLYILKSDEIVLNPDYVEPTTPKPTTGPTTEQVMINQLGLKYAELSEKVDKLKGGAVNG